MNCTATLNSVLVDETVQVDEYVDEYFRQGTKLKKELRISETRRELARWRWRWRCEEPVGGSCNDPLRFPGGCTRDHLDNNLRKRRKITPNSQTSVSVAISLESETRNRKVCKKLASDEGRMWFREQDSEKCLKSRNPNWLAMCSRVWRETMI
jgi:hypothetical protein